MMQPQSVFADATTLGVLTHLLSQGWHREPDDTDTLVKQACHCMPVSCGSGILLLLLMKQMKLPVLRYVAEDGYLSEVYLAIINRLSECVVWEMGWFTWICCWYHHV